MSIFVIADLHLCIANSEKSMEEFGGRWNNYVPRLVKNWNSVVSPDDSVIIPGDISWATGLTNALPDLTLINSLNGTKYVGKGNHDLWWATLSKMNGFFKENSLGTLHILYNNAYLIEDKIICGTRGWFYDEKGQKTVEPTDYHKLINREVIRLKMSLNDAVRIKADDPSREIIVFLHFPCVWDTYVCREIVDVLHEYGIRRCFYGHIHGNYEVPFRTEFEDISFCIISADYLSFVPYLIR